MAKLIPIAQLAEVTPVPIMSYTNGLLTGLIKTVGGVTISNTTFTYDNGKPHQIIKIANGVTTTRTIVRTGNLVTSIPVS